MKGKKHRRQMKRLRKMLADGTRYQGGAYIDGKKHGPWIVVRPDGAIRTCMYRDGERVSPLRKLKKSHWPSPKPTIRRRSGISARTWGNAWIHGPPLQGAGPMATRD